MNHIKDIKKQIKTYRTMTVEEGKNDLEFWVWRYNNRENEECCIGCKKHLIDKNTFYCKDCERSYTITLEREITLVDEILNNNL